MTRDGVGVRPLEASNCGLAVAWTDVFRDRFEGEPVKNVVVDTGEMQARGDFVITRTGIEGGPIYSVSSSVRRALASGRSRIHLDLVPDLAPDRLATRLAGRRPKDSQTTWLRRAGLAPVSVGLLREVTGNHLPDEADAMATLLRSLPLEIESLMPIDRAISSAGGVSFDAVDENLMLRSRPGTFVAGEMLDWDAPTGGYLLQGCFSTGAAAGRAAAAWLDRPPHE